MRHVLLALPLSAAYFLLSHPAYASPLFMGLGHLPGGTPISQANAVSGDGSTVVGVAHNSTGQPVAFRWTSSSGMVGLGDVPGGGFYSYARGVSPDGSVVVGESNGASGTEAFGWTLGGGMEGLGCFPGGGDNCSLAYDVSVEGSIVGASDNGSSAVAPTFEAVIWKSGGMVGLGDLPGGDFNSWATGVSADGSTVVGGSSISAAGYEAFIWTSEGGMVGLGPNSIAFGVSAGGSTVVRWRATSSGHEAFRWTSSSGMVGLGVLGDRLYSRALAVSADGLTIVGRTDSPSFGNEAFIWDATNGMRELDEVLAALGLDLTGWTLDWASGISDDGRVIVGYGTNPSGETEAWIAVIPEPTAFLTQGTALMVLGLMASRRRRA